MHNGSKAAWTKYEFIYRVVRARTHVEYAVSTCTMLRFCEMCKLYSCVATMRNVVTRACIHSITVQNKLS